MDTRDVFPFIEHIGRKFLAGNLVSEDYKFILKVNEVWRSIYLEKKKQRQMQEVPVIAKVELLKSQRQGKIGLEGRAYAYPEGKHAFYLYRNGELMKRTGYKDDCTVFFDVAEPGEYRLKGYVKNHGGITAKVSDVVVIGKPGAET